MSIYEWQQKNRGATQVKPGGIYEWTKINRPKEYERLRLQEEEERKRKERSATLAGNAGISFKNLGQVDTSMIKKPTAISRTMDYFQKKQEEEKKKSLSQRLIEGLAQAGDPTGLARTGVSKIPITQNIATSSSPKEFFNKQKTFIKESFLKQVGQGKYDFDEDKEIKQKIAELNDKLKSTADKNEQRKIAKEVIKLSLSTKESKERATQLLFTAGGATGGLTKGKLPKPPLIQEAKKYKSAEEFVKKMQGDATQYESYTPQARIKGIEGHTNITKLGIDPNQEVTIYRGIDDISGKVKRSINEGDFVTTDFDSALSYTGDPKDVVSMKVKAKDLYVSEARDFKEEPFYTGAEYVYTKQGGNPLTKAELTDIWNKSQPLQEGGQKGLLQIAREEKLAKEAKIAKPTETGLAKPLSKDIKPKPETKLPLSQQTLPEKGEVSFVKPQPYKPRVIDLSPKVKGKERGFVESVANTPEVSSELGKKIRENPEAYYGIKHNKPAIEKAQKKIFENINDAERLATTETTDDAIFTAAELVKQYDSIAQKAKRAGNMAEFETAMDKAVDISLKSAQNLTEAGRTVQAASSISRLSPDGIIKLVNKTIKKVGGKDVTFSNQEYYNIIRQAETIQKTLDPKQRALQSFQLLDDIYSKVPKSTQDKIYDAFNIPRAIMATADFSAPLRQGIFTLARHPIKFAKSFGKMFKYAFSEKAYLNLKADIITSPNYHLYTKHKLPLTDISNQLATREERFMSSMVEKIPGLGKITKGSNRAYTGFLNKMRVDLFDDFVKQGENLGIKDTKFLDDAANFIGASTGRGSLGMLEKAAVPLNSVFFSPRLMASRLKLLNPVSYVKMHPQVRKEAIKSLLAFAGMGLTITGLAKLGGAEVGTDPKSSDFGKIKIGNTRYDPWGGFQQYIKLGGQLITGKMVSSTTGREYTLGEGYKPTTRVDIISRFLQSKENPILSFATGFLSGQNFIGDKFQVTPEAIDKFVPMVIQDMYDLYKEKGAKGIPMALPAIFGVGVQTYGKQIPVMEKTEIGEEKLKLRGIPGLGEDIYNKLTGKQVSGIPKEEQQSIVEKEQAKSQQEYEHQEKMKEAKKKVMETGKYEQVDDTFVYKEGNELKTTTSENTIKAKELYSQWKDLSVSDRERAIAEWKKTISKEKGEPILTAVKRERKNDLAKESGLDTKTDWMSMDLDDRADYLIEKTKNMPTSERLEFLNKLWDKELISEELKKRYNELK